MGGGCAPSHVDLEANNISHDIVEMSKTVCFRQHFISIRGELSILCIWIVANLKGWNSPWRLYIYRKLVDGRIRIGYWVLGMIGDQRSATVDGRIWVGYWNMPCNYLLYGSHFGNHTISHQLLSLCCQLCYTSSYCGKPLLLILYNLCASYSYD